VAFEQRQVREHRAIVLLTDREKEVLQTRADKLKISVSELLRRAVLEYLEGTDNG
jgi:hypothetical protein